LNDVERRSIIIICEDIFHSSRDELTTATNAEHAIPTPGIDPCRGIASRNYRIPEALKGELNQITDSMLEDRVIRYSTDPWKLTHNFGKEGGRFRKTSGGLGLTASQ
jgi:hypothetical protein